LNNNRGNNRRRGRGNNNRQQGGGQQVNRIDSRARGNAPQLLEKYRKLAHDSHLNGDRVTEEYYLQFADHYFRVLADQRQRQEEQRQRRDERWQDGGENEREESEFNAEYGSDGDYTVYDQPHRREREERQPRPDERVERQAEPRGEDRSEAAGNEADTEESGAERSPYEPVENPFVRENRGTRGLRPRREDRRDDRRPRREPREAAESDAGNETPASFDASVLPPPISAPREEAAAAPAEEAEAKPRRTRTRRPRPPADDAGETLETVG
jgi:hypothetical protein